MIFGQIYGMSPIECETCFSVAGNGTAAVCSFNLLSSFFDFMLDIYMKQKKKEELK